MRNLGRAYFSKARKIEFIMSFLATLLVLYLLLLNVPVVSTLITDLDDRIYDQIIRLNLRPEVTNPKVVIIDIDEYSVEKEGRWPWPRSKMAKLIDQLSTNGVVTVGLDMVMSEPERNYALGLKDKLIQIKSELTPSQVKLISSLDALAPKVNNDEMFSKALKQGNVILGFLFDYDEDVKKGKLPTPLSIKNISAINPSKNSLFRFTGYSGSYSLFMNAAAQAGYVTNLPDIDGVLRRSPVIAEYDNKFYPSLAFAITMNYLLVNQITLKYDGKSLVGIMFGGQFIPTNNAAQILIPFWGSAGSLTYYSASDVIQGKVGKEDLQGSIAIVGSTMTLLDDLHQTPISDLFPGVELVGNMVKGLISQQITTQFNWHSAYGIVIFTLIGLLVSLLFPVLGPINKMILFIFTLVIIVSTVLYLFVFKNIYVSSAYIVTLITLQAMISYSYSYIMEAFEKRKINNLFGQYVPKEYVQQLIEHPEQTGMEGQTRVMTVFFADIRNFTTISESLGATEVKQLLNYFFTPITEIIFNYRGTIDKYVGDMIVSFWGAPIEDPDHAYNAISCSLMVFTKIPEINKQLKQLGLPQVKIGIGLATGSMNVGDMGSSFRRAYTVLGDKVNLGSRLQDLTKFYQVNILVSDQTRQGQSEFIFRQIDKVAVKGRTASLFIYEPVCKTSEASEALLVEIKNYHQALEKYYQRDWLQAENEFKKLVKENKDSYLYKMYLSRIEAFKKKEPSDEWDGVYIHTQK